MKLNTVVYIFFLLLLAMMLKLFGIVYFDNYELLAYTFMLYGLSTVFVSMGLNKKIRLFFGSASFFTGIVFFMIENFDIINPSVLVFPSVLFIIGLSCLMLFIDNTSDTALILVSIIFIVLGFIYLAGASTFAIGTFFKSIYGIAVGHWPVFAAAVLIILLLFLSNKKGSDDESE